MDNPEIKVAILGEDPKFRKQLVRLLREEPDICIVIDAVGAAAGIRRIEEQKPDVILVDKNNPFTEGLETTSMVVSRFPDTKVIVLSMSSRNSVTASSCQTWACYSMCENCNPEEILAAIREGREGFLG